jgi:replicative DNA helicase
MSEQRQIPQSVEMESALVGAMISGSRHALETVEAVGVTAAMIERPALRVVFEAILRAADAGSSVDDLLIVERLKQSGRLAEAGGAGEVLALFDRCPAVANVRQYAVEVRDTAILRSLVRRGEQIAALGYERPAEPVELLGMAGQIVDEMTDRASATGEPDITTAADELQPFVDWMQERYDRGEKLGGVSSGLRALDARTGGLKPGELTIIAGRPGMGKSALAAGIAEHLVFAERRHAYSVNLEMRERQQIGRLMARGAGLDIRSTRALPTEADVEGAAAAAMRLHTDARRLHMDRATDLSVTQIRQRARRLHRRLRRDGGEGLSLIVVDYLQLITPPAGERNETAALTVISRGLKSMALELGVHVIALSQLNRSVEDRTPPRPRLSDLRGSGSIEQDADAVLFLFRPDYYLGDDTPVELRGKAELIAAKLREGEPGTDDLRWDGRCVAFSDWSGPVFMVGGAA